MSAHNRNNRHWLGTCNLIDFMGDRVIAIPMHDRICHGLGTGDFMEFVDDRLIVIPKDGHILKQQPKKS